VFASNPRGLRRETDAPVPLVLPPGAGEAKAESERRREGRERARKTAS
jgi:hypothetical protein